MGFRQPLTLGREGVQCKPATDLPLFTVDARPAHILMANCPPSCLPPTCQCYTRTLLRLLETPSRQCSGTEGECRRGRCTRTWGGSDPPLALCISLLLPTPRFPCDTRTLLRLLETLSQQCSGTEGECRWVRVPRDLGWVASTLASLFVSSDTEKG